MQLAELIEVKIVHEIKKNIKYSNESSLFSSNNTNNNRYLNGNIQDNKHRQKMNSHKHKQEFHMAAIFIMSTVPLPDTRVIQSIGDYREDEVHAAPHSAYQRLGPLHIGA